jgi:phosphohistidine phosphatase SixA
MADTSIFSIQPPEWLQKRALLNEEQNEQALGTLAGVLVSGVAAGAKSAKTGTNFMQNWNDTYQTLQDPFYEGKKAQSDLAVAMTKDKLQGMVEYPKWLQSTGGDPEKMLTTPFTGTSQTAAEQVEKAQQTAWMRYTQSRVADIRQESVDNQLQEAELKNKLAADHLAQTERLYKVGASIKQQEADAATTRAAADKTRATTAASKAQFLKSGSSIFKVNPDTQDLEPVEIPNKGLDPAKAITLLKQKAEAQDKLEGLKADSPEAKTYQQQIDAIDAQLNGAKPAAAAPAGKHLSYDPATDKFTPVNQ